MSDDRLEELYRLTKDNNRMLHAMRRNAFIGGVIKFLLYTGLFILLPLWLYATYLAPVVEQIQGTSAAAQVQMENMQSFFDRLDPSQYFGQ